MIQRVRHWASAFFLTLALSLIGYLVFFQAPPLSYGNVPFPVLDEKVHPGDPVRMVVVRYSSADEPRVYDVSHLLICESTTYVLPASQATVMPGWSQVVSAINVVPSGTPPGRCHVEGRAEIGALIRNVLVGWRSQEFMVVP